MKLLLNLFFTFFKIGLFTFGGGYAMIPIIEQDCVEKKQWITHDDMLNLTVIAESTPGPIAINCATFVGYRQKGLIGSIVSTIGIILPSFIVIYFISIYLDNFLEITIIANAFKGIKIAVGVLILDVVINMISKMSKKPLSLIIMISSFLVMFLINIFAWNFSSVSLLIIAAAVNLVIFLVKENINSKGGAVK
ncbi:MAG TPA: chromate transporter [Clostridiaceae bacterium]|nr:chromate transporter [Clostridiaceae bacterium]